MSDPHPDHAENAARPVTTGQHLLGPHVVGQRVVIRRLVPGETGPSGGPALTDVLGICEAWPRGDGSLVRVRRDDGTLVEFPTSVIVSGKPVPPRASVRMRVSAREAEMHGLALWPHLELRDVGEWVLRSDPAPIGRLIKRANSCLAIGDPGRDFLAAEEAVRAFYAERARPALVQVASNLDGSPEPSYVAWLAAGWSELGLGTSHFQLASLAHVRRTLTADLEAAAPDAIILDADGSRVLARGFSGERQVAQGRAALDGDWLGINAVNVDESQRRKGWGRRILSALLTWGAEQGAATAWLHVEADNDAALTWYARAGFRTHHSNRYLLGPGSAWPSSS